MHARRTPRENVFRYPVFLTLLDLEELTELEQRLRLFAVDRPNVVALRSRDHLGDPKRPVKENVLAYASEHGIDLEGGRILLLTNLSAFGYAFNPVSFYWCYRASGELACIVAEVSNTFGEQLPYLLAPGNELAGDGSNQAWTTDKRLHVSPFFTLDQTYTWHFSEPANRVYVRIDVHEGGERERTFWATLNCRRQELTNASLGRALVRYPLMPAQVVARIHWQAVKLWAKGVQFHHKPPFRPGEGSTPPALPGCPLPFAGKRRYRRAAGQVHPASSPLRAYRADPREWRADCAETGPR